MRLRALGLVAASALFASGCTIFIDGHVDVVAVRKVGNDLEVGFIDYSTGTPVWRQPNEVMSVAANPAKTTIPSSLAFRFLGAAGAPVWVLPQTQNPQLLWAGWNTQQIPSGFLQHDRISWKMTHVLGPGAVHLFTTTPLGAPTVLFDSDDGLPDSVNVRIGTHAHGNWAFSAEGPYIVGFEISATTTTGTVITKDVNYAFAVPEVGS